VTDRGLEGTGKVWLLFWQSDLAIIGMVAEPAHPVAALNVAAWVDEVCGLNPVLGVQLQAIKGRQASSCHQVRLTLLIYPIHQA
jgi:hypothetical protein